MDSRFVVRALLAAAGAVGFVSACLPRMRLSYAYDESVTVDLFVDQPSFLSSFTEQQVFNNHLLLSASNWLVWHAGGTTEPWQRLVPLLAGGACVVLVSMWTSRRFGLLGGLVATALVAMNPLLVEFGTQARGYATSVLFIVGASMLLDDWLRDEQARVGAYTALVALALLSHLYVAIVVAAHGVGVLIARRDAFERWFRAALLGGVAALVVYLPTLGTTVRAGSGRPRRFLTSFPMDAAEAIGNEVLVAVALGILVVIAIGASPRVELRWMAVTVGVLVASIWLVLRPYDLYARFLVWLVPLAAIAIAAAVRRFPVAGLVPLVACLAWLPALLDPGAGPSVRAQALAYRDLSASYDVCVQGFFGESFGGYLDQPVQTLSPDVSCDVVMVRASDASELDPDFRLVGTIEGVSSVCLATSRDGPELEVEDRCR